MKNTDDFFIPLSQVEGSHCSKFLLSVYTLDFSLVFLEHIENVQWNKAKPLNQWKAAVIS